MTQFFTPERPTDQPQNRSAELGSQPSDVPVISRKDFLDEWEYAPGTHLTMIGPTQRGKTTFGLQLLGRSISPEHQALVLSGKPPKRDHVMGQAAKDLHLKVINKWPPAQPAIDRRIRHFNGYVLRPITKPGTPDQDNETLAREFRRGILSNYHSNRKNITFVDEAHHVQNDLGLRKEYEAPLLRGAPDNGVWSLIQRGRNVSLLAYDMPDHFFVFHDPDESNRRRYSEMGGVDPKLLQHIIPRLKTYKTKTGQTISQCVYVRRSGPEVKIIDVA